MDLIDVLWRQDIDLEGLEDVSLIRELEKSEEIRLHKKQEEVNIIHLLLYFLIYSRIYPKVILFKKDYESIIKFCVV